MTEAPREFKPDEHVVVEDVSMRFGDFYALKDINITVRRSQIVVVIGGSGAGKTTLLRVLVGLQRPTGGHVYIDGEDIVPLGDTQLNRVRKKCGMVFQYAALLDSLNVMDNVAFPLREHTKLKDKEIKDRVREKLSILGLEDIDDRMPSQLSGGMRKRVGLARALMLEPEFLVYDEPTSGLDPLTSRMVDDLIHETRDRFGVTSVVISHDMVSAVQTSDYVFLLHKGTIDSEGTPKDLVGGSSELATSFLKASGIQAQKVLDDEAARER